MVLNEQLLGNCMCSVICGDGYKRLCIIRKKFTGRRKADNNVMSGTVVLVGIHDYGGNGSPAAASSTTNKNTKSTALKCDLLYVYGDQEKEKLRKACDLSKLNAALSAGDAGSASAIQDDDGIKFVTSGTGVFNKYANEESRKNVRTVGLGLQATATDSARQNTIFGNQWLGEDMLPSDNDEEFDCQEESDSKDEHEDGEDEDEDEDKDEDDEDEECEEEKQKQKQKQESVESVYTNHRIPHKQQKPQAQIINVDDI